MSESYELIESCRVAAPAEYACKAGEGKGLIVEIAGQGVRVQEADLGVETGGNLALNFRLFEAAPPVKMVAEVKACDADGFTAHFHNLDAIVANMLSLVLGRLRERPEGTVCESALLGGF